jgi:opacity protein-like surface antigen
MSQTTSYYSDVKLYGNGVVLTAKLIYPGRRIQLYLGGGAGHYWVMEGIFISLPVVGGYFEIEDTIWGFHAVAGASYDLFRWLYLGLEGKYVILLNFLDTSNITGWALNIGIGVRFL